MRRIRRKTYTQQQQQHALANTSIVFPDTLHDFSMEQVVLEPTRDDYIIDLFLLNQPSLVHSTKILPLLRQGDHDIVHRALKINLGKKEQK